MVRLPCGSLGPMWRLPIGQGDVAGARSLDSIGCVGHPLVLVSSRVVGSGQRRQTKREMREREKERERERGRSGGRRAACQRQQCLAWEPASPSRAPLPNREIQQRERESGVEIGRGREWRWRGGDTAGGQQRRLDGESFGAAEALAASRARFLPEPAKARAAPRRCSRAETGAATLFRVWWPAVLSPGAATSSRGAQQQQWCCARLVAPAGGCEAAADSAPVSLRRPRSWAKLVVRLRRHLRASAAAAERD